jgi:hypothetical protein
MRALSPLLLAALLLGGLYAKGADRKLIFDVSTEEDVMSSLDLDSSASQQLAASEDLLQSLEHYSGADEDYEVYIDLEGKMQRRHRDQCRRQPMPGDRHCAPCQPSKKPCPEPSVVTCCRLKTTTDKVTSYILNKTTFTTISTDRQTKTLVSIRSTTNTTTKSTSSTTTTTTSTTKTESTTTTKSITLPNTTFKLTATVTTTAQQKTITAIVTEEIMPCFTEFETCYYNCPFYEVEPTGCPTGRSHHRDRHHHNDHNDYQYQDDYMPYEEDMYVDHHDWNGNNGQCGMQQCGMPQGQCHNPCAPTRIYVLPTATNYIQCPPTYAPIPPCGCWNTVQPTCPAPWPPTPGPAPPPVPSTITLEPKTITLQTTLPPVYVTLEPNVFCTTTIICAMYKPDL